jgi:hypothetical protein
MGRRLIPSLVTSLVALLGLGVRPGAAAPILNPEQAPAAWVAYAQGATQAIAGWLNADTPPAPDLKAALEAVRPMDDPSAPPLVVKIWVDKAGAISRIDFASLGDAEADQGLRSLLLGRPLGSPPKGMRLPMGIALGIASPPAPDQDR